MNNRKNKKVRPKYIELWDGLIIELNNNIEKVSKETTELGKYEIEIKCKDHILPFRYGFGKDKEERDLKYKEILKFLVD